MTKSIVVLLISLIIFAGVIAQTNAEPQGGLTPRAYLPIVIAPDCASSSANTYASGIAFQHDTDDPVRPAHNHADKNIELRGYVVNNDSGLKRELVNYGSGDPTQPPQLATLFSPNQVPPLADFYKVHNWSWQPSDEGPGMRSTPIDDPPVTAVSFTLPPGTHLHTPISGYDIGGGMEVIVLFADKDTLTLHYAREDSAATGYTIHLDKICTDPNLLALYNTLDNPAGPRYAYPSTSYDLPTLPAGQILGTTGSQDMVVVIADTGAFQDPRSCNEWWQIHPGYGGTCPPGP